MKSISPKVGSNRRGNAGKGRPKGAENKITKSLKEALLSSFESLGGETWLVQLAESDPKAYASLLSRIIPTESSLKVEDRPVFQFVNALPLHPPEESESLPLD